MSSDATIAAEVQHLIGSALDTVGATKTVSVRTLDQLERALAQAEGICLSLMELIGTNDQRMSNALWAAGTILQDASDALNRDLGYRRPVANDQEAK